MKISIFFFAFYLEYRNQCYIFDVSFNQKEVEMKKYNNNGLVIYKGKSMLDNTTDIVVIATGLNFSSNRKTGNMIQTYIIRADEIKPTEAVKNGLDTRDF